MRPATASRLAVLLTTAVALALGLAPSPVQAQSSERIDTEFTEAGSLGDTQFDFSRFSASGFTTDAEFSGIRSDGTNVNGGSVGSISNSVDRALYIEGQEDTDGDGVGRGTPAAVVSRDVNTSGVDQVKLVYRLKSGDDKAAPDQGAPDEYLHVEYRDADGTWVEVEAEVDGDASDVRQSPFEPPQGGESGYNTYRTTLTTDAALHPEFALRFRQEGTTARDPWYVDDMCVLPGGGTCTPGNQTPTVSDIADRSINENETATASVTVGDPDGDGLDVTATSSNKTLLPDDAVTVTGSGTDRTVEATPATDEAGTTTVTVTVDDGTDTINDTFVLTVNDAPRVETNTGVTVKEDATTSITTGELNATDADDDASNLTFSVENGPSEGTLIVGGTEAPGSFTQADLANDVVSYEHSGSETTSDQITLALTDDAGAGPSDVTFNIDVTPVNDAPTAKNDPGYTTDEDTPLEITDPANGVRSNDTDAETATSALTVSTTLVDGPANGSVTLNEDGTFTYTPDKDFNDEDTFTYKVSDGDKTSTATVTVDVAPVPDVILRGGHDLGYDPGNAAPGTDDNPVGRIQLSTDGDGPATLDAVTVSDDGAPSGVTAIELWRSGDASFGPDGNDTEIASRPYSSTVTFDGLDANNNIPASGEANFFIVVDLAEDAKGDVEPFLRSEEDITFSGGPLSAVDGDDQATFSDVFLSGSSTALPVELTMLEAQASDGRVVLTWQTASESGNAGFRVQTQPKSATDASPAETGWTTLGTVDGAGTTTRPQSYRFTTDALDPGTHRFRLKQVDVDGTTSTSRAVTARIGVDGAFELSAFPSPARTQATVELAVQKTQPVTVAVYNVTGQRIATLHRGRVSGGEMRRIEMNTSTWASGVYILQATGETFSGTKRITVVR